MAGRVKDVIISSSGKTMSPTRIEQALVDSGPLVRHAVVIGDGKRYNVALVAIDRDEFVGLVKSVDILAGLHVSRVLGRPFLQQALNLPGITEAFIETVERANVRLSRPEQIKRCFLASESWDEGSDFMTATFKLRRGRIRKTYQEEIKMLYEESKNVVVLA